MLGKNRGELRTQMEKVQLRIPLVIVVTAFFATPGLDVTGHLPSAFPPQQIRIA